MAVQPVYPDTFIEELTRTGRGNAAEVTKQFVDAARRALGLEVSLDARGQVQVTQGATVLPCEPVSEDPASVARFHALHDALNAVALSYFPATRYPEGTLGALLQADGGWARGVSVAIDGVTVTLERAFCASTRMRPTSEWVDYGFVLHVTRDGREVRGTLDRSDHQGNIDAWARLPTSPDSRPQLDAALTDLARQVRAELTDDTPLDHVLNGYTVTKVLLLSLVQRPVPGSLMPWLQEALPRLLGEHVHAVEGHDYRVVQVAPPDVGLEGFGVASLQLVRSPEEDEVGVVSLGSLDGAALSLPGPRTDDERRDLEALISRFAQWLDASLDAFDDLHFTGYFPLVSLVEKRLRFGPPGPPPVPAPDEAALEHVAAELEAVEHEGSIAAWRWRGWTVLAHDDLSRRPFSEPGLSLIPPEGGERCVVMMCDAWNPEAKEVVDGDVFAFRRFQAWLRGAVLASGEDPELIFELAEDDRDEDEPAEYVVPVSEWLLFGLPDFGDEFLVDWRSQWHVVRASTGVETFAGIYGFTGAKLDALRTRDVPTWRRFLREALGFPG